MLSNVNIFLVLNLGSEMLYVIDQRLRAQSIPLDKSARGRCLFALTKAIDTHSLSAFFLQFSEIFAQFCLIAVSWTS